MNDLITKVGHAFVPAAFIHDTPEGIAQIERWIRDYKIGGLTFFYSRQSVETNFDRKTYVRKQDSVNQLARMIAHYQEISSEPLLISIDAEWGLGMRIDSHPPFPYPLTLAATGSQDLIYEAGRAIARELKAVGVHFNLAPVADINNNPKNPVIGYRSFGEQAELVFERSRAYYEGMKSEGLLGCVKHFPGHGDTQVDSHLGLPEIKKSRAELDQNELYPFKEFVAKGVDCVMVGHLNVPAIDRNHPTSLSKKVIQGLLREEWGFEGSVMTDALNMRSVFGEDEAGDLELQAFNAGNDMLSFTPNLEAGFEKIMNHAALEKIEFSYQQVQRLKGKAGLLRPNQNVPTFTTPESSRLRTKLAEHIVTVLKPVDRPLQEHDAVLSVFQPISAHLENQSHQFTLSDASDIENLKKDLKRFSELRLVIYPPSQKPGEQFGMDPGILDFINEIIDQKKVHLAWIGNPYALQYCEWQQCESVVLGYQRIPELEAQVMRYWKSMSSVSGTCPVNLE